MKLTIWQQFSSNHSASYTIVAVFKSGEDAETAKTRLEGILLDIADWYAENESRLYIDDEAISPIEAKVSVEFQIDWQEALLWYEHTAIKLEKQILIIVPQYPTDSGTKEIEALLQKMGANVAVDGGYSFADHRTGFIEIRCKAPDAQTAEELLERYTGSYADGWLSFEPFRFYPVRDFLGLVQALEQRKCHNIVIAVYDQAIL